MNVEQLVPERVRYSIQLSNVNDCEFVNSWNGLASSQIPPMASRQGFRADCHETHGSLHSNILQTSQYIQLIE